MLTSTARIRSGAHGDGQPAEGKQEVMVNGRPRHVLGYLQDFLFHPKRAMTPVKALRAVSVTACC